MKKRPLNSNHTMLTNKIFKLYHIIVMSLDLHLQQAVHEEQSC